MRQRFPAMRALFRPLALLLALCLSLGGLLLIPGAANGQGSVEVYFFHDKNANGLYDAGDDAAPAGGFSIGLSGDETRLDSLPSHSRVTLDAGDWAFTPHPPTGGFRLTDGYLVEYAGSGAQTRYRYTSGGGVLRVEPGGSTMLYIPVMLDQGAGSINGTALFGDGAGMPGALVELLDSGGGTAASTYTGETGSYSLAGLSPGSYRLRVSAAASDRHAVSPAMHTGELFALGDGETLTGRDFTFARTASVTFWMGGVQLAQYPAIAYGALITQPVIDNSALTAPGGVRRITGWYRDAELSRPWNFEADAVTENLNLYARFRLIRTGTGSSSSSGTGGTSRSDGATRPNIGPVSATVTGNTALLTVRAEGFAEFEYHWQRQDQNGYWYDLPDSDAASYRFEGLEPGVTYTFRVGVTRRTDGITAFSQPVTASTADGEQWVQAEAPAVPVPQPTTGPSGSGPGSGDAGDPGELTLVLSTQEHIYTGGRLVAVPSISGGNWEYNGQALEADLSGDPTFTALRAGSTLLTYTVGSSSVTHRLEIRPAALPATGQSVTPPLCLGLLGLAALLGASIRLRNPGKEDAHDHPQ